MAHCAARGRLDLPINRPVALTCRSTHWLCKAQRRATDERLGRCLAWVAHHAAGAIDFAFASTIVGLGEGSFTSLVRVHGELGRYLCDALQKHGVRLSAILIFLRGQISVCGGYMAEFTHAL